MDTSFTNASAENRDFTTEALFTLPPDCTPDAVTSDGHLVTSWAQPDGRMRFVWDDIAGEPFDGVLDMRDKLSAIFTSENGAHLAYAGQRGDNTFIGRDAAEGPSGEGFSRSVPPVFSPDGRHLAYGAYTEGEFRLIVDGAFAGELPIAAVFSPDGERLAFVEVREVANGAAEQRIVIDKTPGHWFRGMRNARGAMQFSPDSRRFAYYRIDEEGHSQQGRGPGAYLRPAHHAR